MAVTWNRLPELATAYLRIDSAGVSTAGSGYSGTLTDFMVEFIPLRRNDPTTPMIELNLDAQGIGADRYALISCDAVDGLQNGYSSTQELYTSRTPTSSGSPHVIEVASGPAFAPRVRHGGTLERIHFKIFDALSGADWTPKGPGIRTPTRMLIGVYNAEHC